VQIWDLERHTRAAVLEGHDADIYAVEYSPDGRLVGSGSGDAIVRLWSADQGKCISQLGGHEVGPKDGVTSIAFSPDSKYIAAVRTTYLPALLCTAA
jgi:glucose repression regulatory protein TUP1